MLSPGHTVTPGLSNLLPEDAQAGLVARIPLRRLGTSDDLGKAAVSWPPMTVITLPALTCRSTAVSLSTDIAPEPEDMLRLLRWHPYVRNRGDVLAVDLFGAGGPDNVLLREYGFSVENVYARAIELTKAPHDDSRRESNDLAAPEPPAVQC